MLLHSQVFEIKYKQSLADYTLTYQKNHALDYEAISQQCEQMVLEMINFDDRLHTYPCKQHEGLFYYFKYVKKNLLLISAIDGKDSGLYED